MNLVLASNSPRRKELLKQIGYEFEVIGSNQEETLDNKLTPLENSLNITLKKAYDVLAKTDKTKVIIAADTIVVKDNLIYGKPKNREDAYQMLKTLNGTSHEVITSLVVIYQDKEYKVSSTANVYVDLLSDKEINNYLDTLEYVDKAGGYAIQGIFSKHIKKIEGDYYAIVGLPINKLYNIFKKIIIT